MVWAGYVEDLEDEDLEDLEDEEFRVEEGYDSINI